MIEILENATDLYDSYIDPKKWIEKVTDHEILPKEIDPNAPDWDWDDAEGISDWLKSNINEYGQSIDIDDEKTEKIQWAIQTRENVYNQENDFIDCFTYTIYSPNDEWYYGPAIIAICFHRGGDPRNTAYDSPRFFYADSLAESGFLDWVIGWDLFDEESGDWLEESEKYSPGYSRYPTGRLDDDIGNQNQDSRVEWLTDEKWHRYCRAKLDGKWVHCYPYSTAERQ